jgi:hydroxypyruvate reductase
MAAAEFARARGLAVHDLGDAIAGEARTEAEAQAALVHAIVAGRGPVRPPCVVLSGGEVVVTVRGRGRGGPNTEFALAFALACEDLPNVWLLGADTDGRDGASGAAGALVGPGFARIARAGGIDSLKALQGNDSAGLFRTAGGLFDPGPTFTNVNDFRAILVLA